MPVTIEQLKREISEHAKQFGIYDEYDPRFTYANKVINVCSSGRFSPSDTIVILLIAINAIEKSCSRDEPLDAHDSNKTA